jgi:methyl-accepting chemotaxis protein
MNNTLSNLKIGARLTLAQACVLLLLAAVAGCGIWGLHTLAASTQRLLAQDVQLAQHAAEMQTLVLSERRFEKDTFINLADEDRRAGYVKKWNDARTRLVKTIAAVRALELTPEDAAAMEQVDRHFAVYVGGFEATLAQIRSGQLKTTQEANADLGKVKDAVHGMETANDELNARAMARARSASERIDAVKVRATQLQLALAALGLVLGLLLCWWVTRSITRPIAQAVAIAETVAAGHLGAQIVSQGRDETAQLIGALKRMNDSLVAIVGEVRHASDSIATGSTEIANGNADLSQRTEEQASNLQQTAASMEQLTATVKLNADTAQHARRLAGEASAVAGQGGEMVSQVVSTMADISASSRKIADIIGVIDAIAFQTNILALNAAVEAARAGEQGRGFAVVAGEVRSLAQRSATAAREIKQLIGESVEKVETGSRLVGDAGRTMTDIVAQVKRVNDLIGEISHASAEQSSGIGQIGDAVSQLDQVTQQNAALVEESAAAAESLKHQAARLTQTVSVFRLAA